MKTPDGIKTIRAMLLNGIFDLIAKAPLVNMKQFNGEYGCLTCTHPGTYIHPRSRVYLPNIEPVPTARTHEAIMQAAVQAETSGVPVHGIKGISVLASSINLVDGIPIDYMDAVLEGVTKWLMRAWFKSENHAQPFYLGRSVQQIDRILMQQHPPSEFSRAPRSIREHGSYWKASELRNWLLYYSLPLLIDFLPSLYFHHYALLVCALHILLQDCLSNAQIDFVQLLPELYGERSCTANAHSLTHLAKYVRLWGPLWTHSAFGFESKNGHLKHLFHARSNIVDQLAFNVDLQLTLQLIHPILQQRESPEVLDFLMTTNGSVLRRGMQKVKEHMYIVGSLVQQHLSTTLCELLEVPPSSQVQTFTRTFYNGVRYHSKAYIKGQGKRNDQICHFNSTGQCKFGQIELFVLTPDPVAIVKVFQSTEATLLQQAGQPCRQVLEEYKRINILSSFVHEIKPPEHSHLEVIPIKDIQGKAVYVQLDNSLYDYVLKQPNTHDHN